METNKTANWYLLVWANIIKALERPSFKIIYPKILTSSKVRVSRFINKSYFSVINKTTKASCLEVSKKSCLFMTFTT